MGCVSEDDLQEYVERCGSPQDLPQIEAHLRACDACRRLLAEIVRPPPAGWPSGDRRLGSRYELLRPIGAGGMGVVYAARAAELHRTVALKMLRPGGGDNPPHRELKDRLLREARAMARLSHRNVLSVYDVGEMDGRVFLAMELVEGGTLRAWLREKPRSVREVLEVFLAAGRGLAAAHAAGLVHRDFKPDNVLIGRDGRVLVTDFGLARFATDGASGTAAPQTGAVAAAPSVATQLAGSPAYMAPEQLRGAPADARSDVFAFCVSLYEALQGELPFAGHTIAELQQSIAAGQVRKPPGRSRLRAALRGVLARGLQADPARRFASMEQLVCALERAARTGWRRRAAALGAVAAAVGGAIWFAVHAGPERHPIVLVADVVNDTREEALDGLSGMLITSLEQSRRFSVLTRSRVFDLLNQYGVQHGQRIDEALGRELSRKAGFDALVLTSVRRFGTRYALDLKVLDPTKDRYLVAAKEEGPDQDAIPAMIDRIAERVRTDLREPVDEIHASAKVADLTTHNLEAYAHYFRAEQFFSELSFDEAETELRAALALDPSFALAQFMLQIRFGEQERFRAGLLLQLADRLPQRYRLIALAEYHRCEGRTAEALELYQQALQSDPTDKHTAFEIGDTLLHVYGDRSGAERWFERVRELDPRYARALQHSAMAAGDDRRYDRFLYCETLTTERIPNLPMGGVFAARALEALGQFEDAERTLQEVVERFPGKWNPIVSLAELHWRAGKFARAEADLAPLLAPERSLDDRRQGLRALAHMEARRGRFARAYLRFDEIAELSRRADEPDEAGLAASEKAFWLAFVRNDLVHARAVLEDGLRESRNPSALAPFAYEVALALGEQERARTLTGEMQGYRSFAEAGAFARWEEGRRDQAIEILQRLARLGQGPEQVLWSYQIARWALEERRPDTAIEFLRWMPRVVAAPAHSLFVRHTGELDAFYAPSFFLLGKAFEMRGETRPALDAYSKFLEIWREADPDEPRLAEARGRIAALNGKSAEWSSHP